MRCFSLSEFQAQSLWKLDISKFPSSSDHHGIRSLRSIPTSTKKSISLSWDNLCCSETQFNKKTFLEKAWLPSSQVFPYSGCCGSAQLVLRNSLQIPGRKPFGRATTSCASRCPQTHPAALKMLQAPNLQWLIYLALFFECPLYVQGIMLNTRNPALCQANTGYACIETTI